MPSPIFTGEYHPDGKADRAQVRADAGHRCIRCGHPYETGLKRADKGEWSECDQRCTHEGGIQVLFTQYSPSRWITVAPQSVQDLIKGGYQVRAHWRILTVHHFDGNKANDSWWNKLALCQVCHLSFQSRVNPEIPWLFEHSAWLKPYVAGFYALKYKGWALTKEEVMADLENLLALERLA